MKKKSFLLLLVCKIYLLLWSYKILVTPNFAREWNIKIPRFRLHRSFLQRRACKSRRVFAAKREERKAGSDFFFSQDKNYNDSEIWKIANLSRRWYSEKRHEDSAVVIGLRERKGAIPVAYVRDSFRATSDSFEKRLWHEVTRSWLLRSRRRA